MTQRPIISERQARDRIETLLIYLRSLLSHAQEDFETATEQLPTGSTASDAALDGLNALSMAGEYLSELEQLERRDLVVMEKQDSLAALAQGPNAQA
ncbi:hypothetical protein [Novosphingobium mathurense]|uniref:Uncharacterized protein n=1 Tax=Novosphingobium mathurense TaxID=428990 RepID=A0A1U6GTP0_9SPHN|nr:hypothetical protein [Novosphingobium mathurense]SLJ86901.1 hypothetical protein SAMN06295987_101410 [Novosphingobium mathurense]